MLLDAGMQGMQITNQSIIYALRPEARSRVNSVYMTFSFLGAAAGSLVSGQLYSRVGWTGDCWVGAGLGVVLVVPTLLEARAHLWRVPVS
ncbi:MAG: MFS transporter [Acidimicrobiales bacterium]